MSHSGAAVVPYVDTASREDMGYTYLVALDTCNTYVCIIFKVLEWTSQAVVHNIHNTHIPIA